MRLYPPPGVITGSLPAGTNTIGKFDQGAAGTSNWLTDMADRAARLLGVLSAGANTIGRVILRNPGDTANMGDATTPIRTDPTGTTTQPVSGTVTAANTAGDVASGLADSGNPVKTGGRAATTNPTAVADGQRANSMMDKMGRHVMIMSQVRDLVTRVSATFTTTTEATVLAAGGVGVFHDLTLLIISNGDTAANRVSIRDATAGTIVMRIAVGANSSVVIPFQPPNPQTTANNNWTAQLAVATTTNPIDVIMVAVKNL